MRFAFRRYARLALRGQPCLIGALFLAASLLPDVASAQASRQDDFAATLHAAMARMDRDMMQPRSGNADRDFAAMMIPHHQGAIDMAEAELRFGHEPLLRRLAQGIIVEQRQEIAVMRQALKPLPPVISATHPVMKMER